MRTKLCRDCKLELPFEDFYKCKTGKFGLQAKCKKCLKEYEAQNKERIKAYRKKWREEHKTETKEYNKAYRQNNVEELKEKKKEYYLRTVEVRREKRKEYYHENRDFFVQKSKEWYAENKERKREYDREWSKEWRLKNKNKVNSYNHKRRAAKKELMASLTEEQWKETVTHFKGGCAYCGKKKKLEQEHFIPLSKGGEYSRDNIIPACRKCNASKMNKDFFVWYPTSESYSIQREEKLLRFLGYMDGEQQLTLI